MAGELDRLSDSGTTAGTQSKTFVAIVAIAGTGLALGAAFFPVMFDTWQNYDDSGMCVVELREFLKSGGLYHNVWAGYGPFYYSFLGAIYRLTGQQPSLFNGRLIVLAFTIVSAGILAAAVWHVTKSMAVTILGEVGAFVVLISVAGWEPLHPGSLCALLLSVLVYALASYAVEPKRATMFVAGAAVGALMMTKINVGVVGGVALVVALVIGNRNYKPRLRAVVAVVALLVPFFLVAQSLADSWVVLFALTVSASLLAVIALMMSDAVSMSKRLLAQAAAGAGIAVAASLVWPLASGSSIPDVISGVLIRPLDNAQLLSSAAVIPLNLGVIVLTLVGLSLTFLRSKTTSGWLAGSDSWWYAALVLTGLWLLAVAAGSILAFNQYAAWLPAFVLLPALAFSSHASATVRLALRFLVPLAILQVLHAYPVAGSQKAWGTVAMTVPCAIAIGVGLEHQAIWQNARRWARALAVAVACLVLVLASGLWPPQLWKYYTSNKYTRTLNLSGAALVRAPRGVAVQLNQITDVLKARCDTFYGQPALNSFYLFAQLPPPTGLVANVPGQLNDSEQRRLVSQLDALVRQHKRVCLLRDKSHYKIWRLHYRGGPLARALAKYTTVVGETPTYEIFRRPTASGSAPA